MSGLSNSWQYTVICTSARISCACENQGTLLFHPSNVSSSLYSLAVRHIFIIIHSSLPLSRMPGSLLFLFGAQSWVDMIYQPWKQYPFVGSWLLKFEIQIEIKKKLFLRSRGPFLERPGNLSGPVSHPVSPRKLYGCFSKLPLFPFPLSSRYFTK